MGEPPVIIHFWLGCSIVNHLFWVSPIDGNHHWLFRGIPNFVKPGMVPTCFSSSATTGARSPWKPLVDTVLEKSMEIQGNQKFWKLIENMEIPMEWVVSLKARCSGSSTLESLGPSGAEWSLHQVGVSPRNCRVVALLAHAQQQFPASKVSSKFSELSTLPF